MTTAVTAKSGSLATRLRTTGSETSIVIQSKESWSAVTVGVLKVNEGISREWISFTGSSESSSGGVYTVTLTGCTRGLKKDAANSTDASSGNKKSHAIGTPVALVYHSVDINTLADEDENNTFSGTNTVTGSFTFSSTTKATFRLQNVTTAQRTGLTGLANGTFVYDTTLDNPYVYQAGAWYAVSTGSVQPDATESVKGVVELATVAEQISAASTGGTGAGLALQAKYLKSTSAGAADEGKIAILNSSGLYDSTFLPTSSYKFGGDGSDGALGAGALTITGSNNTYIVKNYTSFAPGANTVTVTPTGCIVHIKVSGNADLSNTTFSFDGKGGPGGTGGAAVTTTPGNVGTVGTDGIGAIVRSVKGGVGAAPTGATGGTAGAAGDITIPLSTDLTAVVLGGRSIPVSCGAGGGGGSSGNATTASGTSGAGGNGGAGGGCIILEVAGNLTFSSTTITCAGSNGSNGGNGTSASNYAGGGGAGGGGGGGSCVILYGGTLTGTTTPTVSGGTGGTGGTTVDNDPPNSLGSGGGGGGGSSVFADGTIGTAGGTDATNGGAGGNGGAGAYLIAKNTVFQ